MPSEDRRLHPLSVLFGVASGLRSFALPGLLLLIGAGSAGWMVWELWALPFLIPSMVISSVRYFSFRYRYEENEMVIRTGFLFRNERHVPYARIQNVDGVQNVLHRLLNVVEVRVETGGGQEPEAKMSVLPVADFEEMRRRVFEGKGQEDDSPAVPAAKGRTLLQLSPRELILHGFIQNRGFVIVTAGVGLLWEMGIANRFGDWSWGDWQFWERGFVRDLSRDVMIALSGDGGVPWSRIALALVGLAALLVLIRLVSMGWALVRLYGFRLTLEGEDLRTEYGLLTRVTATIPLRRIQTVTVHEGPFHRLFGRASVRVQTAGGGGEWGEEDKEKTQREWLAPILHRDALPGLLREVLPGLDLAAVEWHPVHPRAFRRELKSSALFASLFALPFVMLLRWWDLGLLAALLAWAAIGARLYVKHLGWATTDRAVLLRTGWAWRQISVAPFVKIQAVAIHESPFDRRAAMARVRVDTAGSGEGTRRVDIPYLSRETARDLYDLLATQAAQTAFRW
jgi:putative membrane protein